jgi:hypothetical protein
MTRTTNDYLWVVAFAVIVTFAVPWFLWRSDAVVAGLPVWLWWHVGWMLLASATFALFTRTAWDRGMTGPGGAATDPGPGPTTGPGGDDG